MIKPTDTESTHMPTVPAMKENGLMTSNTVKEEKPGLMAVSTMDIT